LFTWKVTYIFISRANTKRRNKIVSAPDLFIVWRLISSDNEDIFYSVSIIPGEFIVDQLGLTVVKIIKVVGHD